MPEPKQALGGRLFPTPRLAGILIAAGISLGAVGLTVQQGLGLACDPLCSLRSGPWLALGLLLYSAGAVVTPSGFVVLGAGMDRVEDKFAHWFLAAISSVMFLAVFLYVNITAA